MTEAEDLLGPSSPPDKSPFSHHHHHQRWRRSAGLFLTRQGRPAWWRFVLFLFASPWRPPLRAPAHAPPPGTSQFFAAASIDLFSGPRGVGGQTMTTRGTTSVRGPLIARLGWQQEGNDKEDSVFLFFLSGTVCAWCRRSARMLGDNQTSNYMWPERFFFCLLVFLTQ